MPNALSRHFGEMSKDVEAALMLSGYGDAYIHEWSELYFKGRFTWKYENQLFLQFQDIIYAFYNT